MQPHLPTGLQLPGKELAYDESMRKSRGDVNIRAGWVVIRVTARFPPTSLPAMPEESCPWLPAPGLGRLCHVDYGWSAALKGFCAARGAGEGSAAKRKREESLLGAAATVEVFGPARSWSGSG